MKEIFLITLLAYLIGSIPTAYLFLRMRHARDIRREGTGNVGALNAFEVTRSKSTGLLVLLIDFLKGLAALLLARALFSGNVWNDAAAGIAVVAGHNFSPWIGFKGGRGLATGAGAAALPAPSLILFWCVLWSAVYLAKKEIHWGNILASLLAPILFLASSFLTGSDRILLPERMAWGAPLTTLVVGMFFLILLKHIEPLKALLRQKNRKIESV